MILLRAPLQPPEITQELLSRFDVVEIDAAIENKEQISVIVTKGDIGVPKSLMDMFSNLKLITVYGVGTDKIDLAQARERGIEVTTTPGVLTDAVAEQAIALMLAACRRIAEGDRFVRSGQWATGKLGLGYSLSGRSLGVVGYGRIGSRIGVLARGFGMSVLYSDLVPKVGEEDSFRATPLLLANDVDILVIAAAGGKDTAGIIDTSVINALGPHALLVNVSRGSIVNEEHLVSSLLAKRLGGAALDVFSSEPHPHPELLKLPNVVMTPHLASATTDARLAMGRMVIDNLSAFFAGKPLLTPLGLT